MLTPHRRHLKACEHRAKGWNFTLCDCPVWCDGLLDGRRFIRSLGTRNWERALAKIAALDRGADVGIELHPGRSMAHAVAAFIQSRSKLNLKPSTVSRYTRALEPLEHALGKRQIGAVTPAALSAYLDSRKTSAGEALAPRTKRVEIEFLRALFAWCVEQGWCTENPAKRIRPPKVEDVATLPFTEEEVSKLLSACDRMRAMWKEDERAVRQRARALLLALLYSGLRVGDVAQLRRGALESTGHLVIRTMKTGVRLKVLLHETAVSALRALPAPGGNPEYFFWSGNGDVEDCSKSLWRTVSRVGKVAGVHAHPHRFRDTFAVELLSQGADIRTVQQLLGHESVRTTEKHYAHFVAAHQKLLDSAVSRLNFERESSRPLLVSPKHKRLRNG